MASIPKIRNKIENGAMGSLSSSYGSNDNKSMFKKINASGGVGQPAVEDVTKKSPYARSLPPIVPPRPQKDSAQDEPETGPNG